MPDTCHVWHIRVTYMPYTAHMSHAWHKMSHDTYGQTEQYAYITHESCHRCVTHATHARHLHNTCETYPCHRGHKNTCHKRHMWHTCHMHVTHDQFMSHITHVIYECLTCKTWRMLPITHGTNAPYSCYIWHGTPHTT